MSEHSWKGPRSGAGISPRVPGRPAPIAALSSAGAVAGLLSLVLFLVPGLGMLSAAAAVVCSGAALALQDRTRGTSVRAIGGLTCAVAGAILSVYALVSA